MRLIGASPKLRLLVLSKNNCRRRRLETETIEFDLAPERSPRPRQWMLIHLSKAKPKIPGLPISMAAWAPVGAFAPVVNPSMVGLSCSTPAKMRLPGSRVTTKGRKSAVAPGIGRNALLGITDLVRY
ncbi:hypothetical protein L209DRAFT_527751 [Thermothelomyces heterothallicus CBS 203.75]